MQAGGTQQGGLMASFSGLDVILDSNIPTTNGAGTNEDVILVLAKEDFILMESPIFARNPDVGSGNGLIRFEIFQHSAFLSKRYPKSASVISGTGLVASTFQEPCASGPSFVLVGDGSLLEGEGPLERAFHVGLRLPVTQPVNGVVSAQTLSDTSAQWKAANGSGISTAFPADTASSIAVSVKSRCVLA